MWFAFRAFAFLIAPYIAIAQIAMAASSDFDPETGLRIHHYTDPVPGEVPGTVLDTAGVKELVDSGRVVLIDVLSISGVRYDELDGSGQTTSHVTTSPGVCGYLMLATEDRRPIC